MSNRCLQDMMLRVKDIIEEEAGVLNEQCEIVACTEVDRVGQYFNECSILDFPEDYTLKTSEYIFRKVYIRNKSTYITYMKGVNPFSEKYLSLIGINIANIECNGEEKLDKSSFFKNLILGNILPGDVSPKAKELNIPFHSHWMVLLIQLTKVRGIYAYEVAQRILTEKMIGPVVVLDEGSVVLLKEIVSVVDNKEIENIAHDIVDSLSDKLNEQVRIGIGTAADNIMDISRSYKEAQVALQVCKIFDQPQDIVNYNNLGIARLIYQLPITLCNLFLKEVFKGHSMNEFDQETLFTVQKFFENNLILSETARQLYVHRNTLVYRLDKIQKVTGLDLREFDDAVIFKVAVLVWKYMENEKQML